MRVKQSIWPAIHCFKGAAESGSIARAIGEPSKPSPANEGKTFRQQVEAGWRHVATAADTVRSFSTAK